MSGFSTGAPKIEDYAPVNGLRMYYEIEGAGAPLVFIPPAFGFAGLHTFPLLTQTHMLITPDLQGHGRTADIADRKLSIDQYAEDVIGLLDYLGIASADIFGESYGASAAVMLAVRHPTRVRRVATYGATFGPPSSAHNAEMLRFDHTPTASSRDIEFQRENFKTVAPDPEQWANLYTKVCNIDWNGFSKQELASIKAPMLIMLGDHDFVKIEHALDAFRAIPDAELAVVPSGGHFTLYSEPHRVVPLVKHFLDKPDIELPLATAGIGYHPGETR